MNDTSSILSAILQRNSAGKLSAPGPDAAEIKQLIQAALRAPDHARLQPWRFIVIEGESRQRLGQLMADVQQQDADGSLSEEKLADIAAKPLRAPLIIAPVMSYQAHPKVPEIEQVMSVACACQNLLLAAEALGYAGIWRTGPLAFDQRIEQGLGLADNEKLLGFIYLGTRAGEAKTLPALDTANFIRYWPAE